MPRYFLELAYKGTNYSGFQKQENSNTIQAEVEKAFQILQGQSINLTGSSRTDAGVHALQNFFHFDFEEQLHSQFLYKTNAILPDDIVIKQVYRMPAGTHSRFDAVSRKYEYRIYRTKNPFLKGQALYYPFKVDIDIMRKAAEFIKTQTSFFAFTKTNTQVKNFSCAIYSSGLLVEDEAIIYTIEGNRFLRGMVRLLTASILQVGRGKITLGEFKNFFGSSVKCGYSIPAHGLYLTQVNFPENYFQTV
jgi:tRNA pseudouridine38-40 synthase